MKTYEHKGITITFDVERAHFYANAKGKKLNAPSLDAMRKQIDASLAIAFEPFKAHILSYGAFKLEKVIHVGKGSHRNASFAFHTDQGSERYDVVIDTPTNRRLVTNYMATNKEGKAEIERINARISAALKAVPTVKADAFAAKTKAAKS